MSETYCSTGVISDYNYKSVDNMINDLVEDISLELAESLAQQCETLGGLWVGPNENSAAIGNPKDLQSYYNAVYNNNQTYVTDSKTWGRCAENTTRVMCEIYNINSDSGNQLATYDPASDSCKFSTEWYQKKCTEELGGIWDDSMCYMI